MFLRAHSTETLLLLILALWMWVTPLAAEPPTLPGCEGVLEALTRLRAEPNHLRADEDLKQELLSNESLTAGKVMSYLANRAYHHHLRGRADEMNTPTVHATEPQPSNNYLSAFGLPVGDEKLTFDGYLVRPPKPGETTLWEKLPVEEKRELVDRLDEHFRSGTYDSQLLNRRLALEAADSEHWTGVMPWHRRAGLVPIEFFNRVTRCKVGGVCRHTAKSFLALLIEIGIPTKDLRYVKGYNPNLPVSEPGHGWARVRIDGKWKVYNPTASRESFFPGFVANPEVVYTRNKRWTRPVLEAPALASGPVPVAAEDPSVNLHPSGIRVGPPILSPRTDVSGFSYAPVLNGP